jgi:hypothetical protein
MKSRGLGDTLEKFTKYTGIDSLAKLTSSFAGVKDCGCNKRKAWLNKQVPYKQNRDGNKHR